MLPIYAAFIKTRATEPRAEPRAQPTWWRVSAYASAVAPFLFFVASAWIQPDLKWQETPDWKPVLALADAAWEKRDPYEAKHLYLQAGRIASWAEDWRGLLAAACGIQKIDREHGPYSGAHTLLGRAMLAAEMKQSRAGMTAVAKALTALGKPEAASLVLARIQTGWPEETQDSPAVDGGDCLGA
jgi:hypothetical protein